MTATLMALESAIQDHKEWLRQFEGRRKTHAQLLKEAEEGIENTKNSIADLKNMLARWFSEAGGSDGSEDKEKEEVQAQDKEEKVHTD